MKHKLFTVAMIIFLFSALCGQTRTVGLFLNDTAHAFKGYTLFAPKQNTMTYLINNDGRIVHEWTASKYPPGQSVYLLENGDLLRPCMVLGQLRYLEEARGEESKNTIGTTVLYGNWIIRPARICSTMM